MTKAEALIALRARQGLTQVEMAKKCNVSVHSWGNYEKGLTEPRQAVMAKICSAFGISEEELLEEKEQPAVTEKKTKNKKPAKKAEAPEAAVKEEKSAPAEPLPDPAAEFTTGPKIFVQSQMQDNVAVEDIIRKVRKVAPHAQNIYIKPGDNRAYWTAKEEADWVWLW